MVNKYLKKSESISNKKNFGVDIYFYVHPETRRIETAWLHSPLGISEWDFDEQGWVPLDGSDPRGLKWQKYVVYKVDWDKDDVLPEELYKAKNLSENILKEHAKLVHDEFGQDGRSNNKNFSWDETYLTSLVDQLMGWQDFVSKSRLVTSSSSPEYQANLGEYEILALALDLLTLDESEDPSHLLGPEKFLEVLRERLVKISSLIESDDHELDADYNSGRIFALSAIIKAVERNDLLR